MESGDGADGLIERWEGGSNLAGLKGNESEVEQRKRGDGRQAKGGGREEIVEILCLFGESVKKVNLEAKSSQVKSEAGGSWI